MRVFVCVCVFERALDFERKCVHIAAKHTNTHTNTLTKPNKEGETHDAAARKT
jgi:hypothetical protein